MTNLEKDLVRIGVFYDGKTFKRVSNYYRYFHPVQARIRLNGLHDFICAEAAMREGGDRSKYQITEAHHFSGRLKAREAGEQLLKNERSFDDVLIHTGVTAHRLTLPPNHREKGIDVWIAVKAFDLAKDKRFHIA
ncbi:MAG: cold-shock protein, partial [Candidatus Hodarchaeota archaeon]